MGAQSECDIMSTENGAYGEKMPASIFDNFKMPPVAVLLGWRLIDINLEEKWIRLGFEAKPEFLNPMGNIQGGILAAMLDDTMGPLVVASTNRESFGTTIDLNVSFIRPVRPGPITATAQITGMGTRVAFMEGKLFDSNEKLCVRATATALLVKFERPAE